MTKVDGLFDSLKNKGIKRTFEVLLSYAIDYFFDIKYGTDTCSWVQLDDLNLDNHQKKRAEMYQLTHALPLRKLFRKLKIPPGNILVDLGCGKGRVLLVASEFFFREARGIEFSSVLCKIATKNCSIYKDKKKTTTDFIISNLDVLEYKLNDDEDVFFMFNPFDAYVLTQVLQNITVSIQRRKRKIWIIYRHAVHRGVLDKNKSFIKLMDFVFLEQKFVVYTNNETIGS